MLRTRGYLPRLEHAGSNYFVTFRLAGSLPKTVRDDFVFERNNIEKFARDQSRVLSKHEKQQLDYLLSSKVQQYLDRCEGDCWLQLPAIAEAVIGTMKHFNGLRYELQAWCIMPNHVHVVFTDNGKSNLKTILHYGNLIVPMKLTKY